MSLPPAPKFEKRNHHVVPQFWQKCFASQGEPGPYYLNILTGERRNAQGPGVKMSEEYANIIFDEYYRPNDKLEDDLSLIEKKMKNGLSRLFSTGELDNTSRGDIAMLLAIQNCRYPEFFSSRMDLAKYLAISLADPSQHNDVNALNSMLDNSGLLTGAHFTDNDFQKLKNTSRQDLDVELDHILQCHGYEAHFNPSLIMDAALQIAEHLLGLHWQLLRSSTLAFILSDRPVPQQFKHSFSVGLSASYCLVVSKPEKPILEGAITPRVAKQSEIDAVNREVRSRALEWICGPGEWVHSM